MKILAFVFLLMHSWIVPNPPTSKFDDFLKYVMKSYKLPDTYKSDCNWYYAAIKCSVDNNGRIVRYKFLNDAPNELVNSFSHIKGYSFPKKLAIRNRSVVFFMTIENLRETCKIERNKFYTSSEVATRIYGQIAQQMEKEPSTILIYPVVIFPVHEVEY